MPYQRVVVLWCWGLPWSPLPLQVCPHRTWMPQSSCDSVLSAAALKTCRVSWGEAPVSSQRPWVFPGWLVCPGTWCQVGGQLWTSHVHPYCPDSRVETTGALSVVVVVLRDFQRPFGLQGDWEYLLVTSLNTLSTIQVCLLSLPVALNFSLS